MHFVVWENCLLKDKNVYSELLANDVDISESLVLMHSVKYGLKDFVKFTGKHLYWSIFFNKIAGLVFQFYYKKTPIFKTHLFCRKSASFFFWVLSKFHVDLRKFMKWNSKKRSFFWIYLHYHDWNALNEMIFVSVGFQHQRTASRWKNYIWKCTCLLFY